MRHYRANIHKNTRLTFPEADERCMREPRQCRDVQPNDSLKLICSYICALAQPTRSGVVDHEGHIVRFDSGLQFGQMRRPLKICSEDRRMSSMRELQNYLDVLT